MQNISDETNRNGNTRTVWFGRSLRGATNTPSASDTPIATSNRSGVLLAVGIGLVVTGIVMSGLPTQAAGAALPLMSLGLLFVGLWVIADDEKGEGHDRSVTFDSARSEVRINRSNGKHLVLPRSSISGVMINETTETSGQNNTPRTYYHLELQKTDAPHFEHMVIGWKSSSQSDLMEIEAEIVAALEATPANLASERALVQEAWERLAANERVGVSGALPAEVWDAASDHVELQFLPDKTRVPVRRAFVFGGGFTCLVASVVMTSFTNVHQYGPVIILPWLLLLVGLGGLFAYFAARKQRVEHHLRVDAVQVSMTKTVAGSRVTRQAWPLREVLAVDVTLDGHLARMYLRFQKDSDRIASSLATDATGPGVVRLLVLLNDIGFKGLLGRGFAGAPLPPQVAIDAEVVLDYALALAKAAP